jgi:hypothetical protein
MGIFMGRSLDWSDEVKFIVHQYAGRFETDAAPDAAAAMQQLFRRVVATRAAGNGRALEPCIRVRRAYVVMRASEPRAAPLALPGGYNGCALG